MPLPLPNLDTRRWDDMVEEGRALLPRYAPAWTDHNVHDPGVMLIELFSWLVEQDIYQVNRVPDRHKLKFLSLVGFLPTPPKPAEVPISFTLAGTAIQQLPKGLVLATDTGLPFRLENALTVIPATLEAVQVFDGTAFADKTRLWRDEIPFGLWGDNPDANLSPALYLGFDQALPVSEKSSLWFWLGNVNTGRDERLRLIQELAETAVLCQPLRPQTTCTPKPPCPDPWCPDDDSPNDDPEAETGETSPLTHHAITTVWEYFDGADWQPIPDVVDQTRGFTLDGPIHLTLPADMQDTVVGALTSSHFYLRCRLQNGRSDAAPTLKNIALNTALAEQSRQTYEVLDIAVGTSPPAGQEPVVGAWQNMHLHFDEDGNISQLAAGEDVSGPTVFVLAYEAAMGSSTGTITITLTLIGSGSGLPEQLFTLRNAPISGGDVQILLDESGVLTKWSQRPDFDAAKTTDAVFTLDPTNGDIRFGNGNQGRVPPDNAPILAAYSTTNGKTANIPANQNWQLTGVDDLMNTALLGGDVELVAAELAQINNYTAAQYGSDQEPITHAAGRAVESLWAHERILELVADGQISTLDQLDRTAVLSRQAPNRATTLLDYERLALSVPGTKIKRARAWAGLDPNYPCLQAPGTVTVVIVPTLPLGAPNPTNALLNLAYRYLNRRRILGTRLVVVGPTYLEVSVQAEVRTRSGANNTRVQTEIQTSLNNFLDPLTGGPNGFGWPFGRDVYRSEILQVIDNVSGVDHVLSLDLIPGEGEPQCANLCLNPTWLVKAGRHEITVL